jgi:spore maturation protein CgeB
MRILFVGVFTEDNRSTNDGQARGLEQNGHEVIRYNYRIRKDELGSQQRDSEIICTAGYGLCDLVIFSKCNGVSIEVISQIKAVGIPTCLWFMDAYLPNHWTEELILKMQHCTYVCCDKYQAVGAALNYNPRTYHVCEGYDDEIDKPYNYNRDIDCSFIGDPYGNRGAICRFYNINIFQSAYGEEHAKVVSRSKINLNFCTGDCASDRVYKILGAGGLLLTDDWYGRSSDLEDGTDLVIFNNTYELAQLINKYLEDDHAAQIIRDNGHQTVKQYTRKEWARRIIEYAN